MEPHEDSHTANYSALATAILDYLHTGKINFSLADAIQHIADSCSKSLENDWCVDEAINEAVDFINHCNTAAINGEHYELASMQKQKIEELELDQFSYYLLGIKRMPSSHNLRKFRKHQYMALYIISRIIKLGLQDRYRTEKEGLKPSDLVQITKLYDFYCLLRDRETHINSGPGASEQLANAYTHDIVSRGVGEIFGDRINAAIDVIYKDNKAKFLAMSDVDVARYISENDKFLDYYFHSSTPKSDSLSGQKELDSKGYFSSVLEKVKNLRT